MLLNPDLDVRHGKGQMLSESMSGRAKATGTPVVDSGHGDSQVCGDFPDIHQMLQTPFVLVGDFIRIHED